MAAKTGLFTNAQDFNIQGSNITTNQTTTTIFQLPTPVVDPWEIGILHKHRALEASHTSKTAESAPKCKPGTRIQAIKDLTAWAKEVAANPSSSEKLVLWFPGPAGAGKTCIMREVARICRRDKLLVGDYFFSTRVPGLDDETPFVATIVSHLIRVIPELDNLVQDTIRRYPDIFELALEFQVEELISKHIVSIPPQTPRILLVDGFDECRDRKQRARLLRLIHSLVTPPHSFRVIIASRPELDIRTAFDLPPLKSITKILRLENYEASGEIYQYLSDEFARIRQTHPAKQSIPLEWPGRPTLHALTDKSSRGYIYPSVIVKYVDNPRRHPVELLKHILNTSSTASSRRPFAELDAIYEIILNPPDVDIPLMKRLLHIIIEITRLRSVLISWGSESLTHQILSAPNLDEFLSLGEGMTEIILCDLHSILSITEDTKHPYIYFHHKSLEDYLCSPERAGDLYQSQANTHSDILSVCFHYMGLWNQKLVSLNADFQSVNTILEYSCLASRHLLFTQKCFPPSVLDFDARIVWRCLAFAGRSPPKRDEFNDFVKSFHNAMCKEQAECQQSCASFRRMLEYRDGLLAIAATGSFPMTRLKRFERECRGLFAPLDLSPPKKAIPTFRLRLGNASARVPPPKTSSKSGTGNVTRDRHIVPKSTSMAGSTQRPQGAGFSSRTTPQPAKPGCAMM